MTGVVTPYSLMFGGVAAAVLPIAPIPGAAYLREWLRRQPIAAFVWYLLALAGCVWAAVAFVSRQPQLQWALGLGLALSWWFLATETTQQKKEIKERRDAQKDMKDRQNAEGGGADA
jgi:hypothetical protein